MTPSCRGPESVPRGHGHGAARLTHESVGYEDVVHGSSDDGLELIGEFAVRVDAWILAEGVERIGELEELIRLRVPLGQGLLLGRPADEQHTALSELVVNTVASFNKAVTFSDTLTPLIERARP